MVTLITRPIPTPTPERAWKMVDACHAHFLEQGSLRLGRPQDYAAIENGRADKSDSAAHYVQDFMSWQNPGDRAALRALGMEGTILASNNSITITSAPCYILCLTVEGNDHDPDERDPPAAKAIFAISRLGFIARHLIRTYPDRFTGRFGVGAVQYRTRIMDAYEVVRDGPDPFVKSDFFAAEREVRLVLEARTGPDAALYQRFDTPPDEVVARCIRRVSG